MQKWSTVFLLVGSMLFSASALTLSEKEKFVDFYISDINLKSDFPELPKIRTLFFNLDGTNTFSIVTNDGSDSCYGYIYLWEVYGYRNAKWSGVKLKMETEAVVAPESCLDAPSDHFFSLNHPEHFSKLIVVHVDEGQDINDFSTLTSYSHIRIDENGFLVTTPYRDLRNLLDAPASPWQLQKLIPEIYTKAPSLQPDQSQIGLSTNQTVVVEKVPVLKSGTTEK